MKKEITRVDVLQAGIIAGILYALLAFCMMLIYAPFMFLFMGAAGASQELGEVMPFMGGGIIAMLIFFPIIYGVLGFIFGALGAWLYNIVAKWVGGYRFTMIDVVE